MTYRHRSFPVNHKRRLATRPIPIVKALSPETWLAFETDFEDLWRNYKRSDLHIVTFCGLSW